MAETAVPEAYLGIVSDRWIEETLEEQRLLIGQLATAPRLDLVTTLDSQANGSYERKSIAWGEVVGVHVVPHHFDNDFQAATCIQELGEDDEVDGILAFLPSWTSEGEAAIRWAMPGTTKDVDGVTLSSAPVLVPATAEGMGVAAERVAQRQLQELGRIGVIGYGERTLQPFVERVLKDRKIEPSVLVETRADIEAFQRGDRFVKELLSCDAIFTAVPVGCLLTPDRVRQGQIIIDVGYGLHPETLKPCGNVDPRIFALNGMVRAMAFRRGNGPLTTAITQGRTIDNRIAKEGYTKAELLALAA
jgi:5,10-methylene-tetrahydrofolate dehydrogenase/methenyl tetrahydrofolate cyclohydrolase